MRTRNGPSPSSAAASCRAYAEITAYDDPHELTLDELKQLNPDFESKYTEYGDAAIVVVSRVGGEAGAYYPGEEGLADGVHTVNGNILSLSDEEMAMIEEAKANFDQGHRAGQRSQPHGDLQLGRGPRH